ncbi:MAG: hypothetical protein ACD_73C00409G0001, partial [uncultured bacterium]
KRAGGDRDFFQGLIILAGAFCHLNKNRWHPANLALQKAFDKLSLYLPEYHGVKTGEVLTCISAWKVWLEGGPLSPHPAHIILS